MSARDSIEGLWDRATPVGPLLDAYRAEVLREAAKELTNLPLWYTADLHADWETGVQEAASRVQGMANEAATGGVS